MDDPSQAPLNRTPLYDLHVELGARMVPFAGYAMPVQYPAGIIAEHLHTRAAASLFDVSHMGQIALSGAGAAAALETLAPGDILGLAAGRMRYTLFTNEEGGILDDLMVTNEGRRLALVVNAAQKHDDLERLRARIGAACRVEAHFDRALLALQGPGAAQALAPLAPGSGDLVFMAAARLDLRGVEALIGRAGYTGEDGFEISVDAADAERVARLLLEQPGVRPAGLGARDSLRLEAGLCLYGHDIDGTTTPVEAGLAWTVAKRRREEGGFPGHGAIRRQLREGVRRRRVGLLPEGRAPAREGAELRDATGKTVGQVTSGGYGPTVGGPVAMGYVETARAASGTSVAVVVRGRPRPARLVDLPFVAPRYHR